jgi:uncharacterized protein YecT (DUF1311 family)
MVCFKYSKLGFLFFIFFSITGYTFSQQYLWPGAISAYEEVEQEMNDVYKKIQEQHAQNELFLEKLKIAQLKWTEFRIAETEAQFPVPEGESPLHYYGSIYPLELSDFLINMTRQRIKAFCVG